MNMDRFSGRSQVASLAGRLRPRLICGLLCAFWLQANLLAWGLEVHRWVHARALERLPSELAARLGPHQEYLVDHAVDPDRWRESDPDENPRHFIDLDRYGLFPFPRLTLDYEEMVRRHGPDKVKANGLALWTISRVMERLEEAFRSGEEQAMLRAAVALGHYVADLHQPFHTVANFDGQLSGQRGIHARFEVEVANRVLPALSQRGSDRVHEFADPLKESFDIALESFSMVNLILVAEWKIVRDLDIDRGRLPRDPRSKAAIYPDSYFRLFTEAAGPVASRRIQDAAWAVASFWTQAWKNSRK